MRSIPELAAKMLISGHREAAPPSVMLQDGGSGNDTLVATTPGETIHGGDGNDVITGSSAANAIGANPVIDAADLLYGDAGDDVIHGGNELVNVWIYEHGGGGVYHQVWYDDGGDTIQGGDGNDSHY